MSCHQMLRQVDVQINHSNACLAAQCKCQSLSWTYNRLESLVALRTQLMASTACVHTNSSSEKISKANQNITRLLTILNIMVFSESINTLAAWISRSSTLILVDRGFSMQMKNKSDFSKATLWACLQLTSTKNYMNNNSTLHEETSCCDCISAIHRTLSSNYVSKKWSIYNLNATTSTNSVSICRTK